MIGKTNATSGTGGSGNVFIQDIEPSGLTDADKAIWVNSSEGTIKYWSGSDWLFTYAVFAPSTENNEG